MRPRFPMLAFGAAIAAMALFVAACGEDSRPDFSDEIPEGAPHMDQRSLRFDPTNLTVEAGQQVYFTNSETAVHTIDVDGENISGDMRRGDVVAFTFDTPGTYDITCPYHPQMRATVTVQ